jgi:predicted PurR-regulated permease PerM
MASRLRHLLGGRLLGMLIEGIFTYVMLMAYGVPLAALLGMITGVLAFIPNIGAIISGVLMVTVGFTGGVEMGLYTIFVYFFVQTIDGWILVPLIAKRTVDLAPALVLGWQLILGVLFGILGLALADPMLAMIKVALERRAERQDEVLKRREAHRHNQPASKRRTRKTAKAT